MSNLRVVVAQRGARRGYDVPSVLHKAGMLECLYTDACGNVGWGRWMTFGTKLPRLGSMLAKLANRRVPRNILNKTKSFISPDLMLAVRNILAGADLGIRFRNSIKQDFLLGRLAVRSGFGTANALFVMLDEFSPLIKAAKAQGLTIVSDVYILISTERILTEERHNFPGWEPDDINYSLIRRQMGNENVLLSHVDHYLCPSAEVQSDLVTNWGVATERTHLVPYGMSTHWLELIPAPKPGRIVFIGTADLRKGIHYLAMAANELYQRGRRYEFRVAGDVKEMVRNHSMCEHLVFLGRVPRDRIHEEFQAADVFVLPSLAEGSAGVTYEAMAAAVPQVVTKSAGSVARDGVEGRVVPERDPIALADAIEEIVENRALRDRMALASRERARDYTWDKYQERLVNVMMGFSR
jgi:glycosyltransferase involved in cell wall biosynthesis